jgi:RecB family exonuclease
MSLPQALPLGAVSPSGLKDLTECSLRVAFKQHATRSPAQSDAQVIGNSLHTALAAFVKAREFGQEDAVRLAVGRFLDELERQGAGRDVRGTRVAAARLRKLVARIIELTGQAGSDALTLSEEPLEARSSVIRGVIDLIIDSETLHVIVDYKTGQVTDGGGDVAPQTQVQAQLYAVLEHERSGRWPQRGVLLCFGRPPLLVDLDPAECEQIADRAVDALAAYNTLTGIVPPASAGEAACRFCSFAPRCPAFWDAISPRWTRRAVRGRVAWVESSAAGGLTVGLEDAIGSHEGMVVIRRLGEEHVGPNALPVGVELIACGVHADSDGRLLLDKSARIAVVSGSE